MTGYGYFDYSDTNLLSGAGFYNSANITFSTELTNGYLSVSGQLEGTFAINNITTVSSRSFDIIDNIGITVEEMGINSGDIIVFSVTAAPGDIMNAFELRLEFAENSNNSSSFSTVNMSTSSGSTVGQSTTSSLSSSTQILTSSESSSDSTVAMSTSSSSSTQILSSTSSSQSSSSNSSSSLSSSSDSSQSSSTEILTSSSSGFPDTSSSSQSSPSSSSTLEMSTSSLSF